MSKLSQSLSRHTRVRGPMAALIVAGLLSATALTAVTTMTPAGTANAQATFERAPAQGFADLVDNVMPSVFSVEVKFKPVANNSNGSPSFGPDLGPNNPFRHFFEEFRGREFAQPHKRGRRAAQGSGFVVSADGYAVTNNHVIRNASEVTITMHDGASYDAKVVGSDPKTDLALLKIDSDETFAFVEFAEDQPRVGDWVVAVGNPFGLGGSVTTGVISAQGRNIGSGPYDNYLQIDAPINRGNSGGPAFNLKGEVIGVNTAIFSPSGGNVGIGFAIPAAITKDVISDLKDDGSVTRGWLGVQIQAITDDIADSLKLDDANGAMVSDVTQGSPAEDAGVKTGDAILKLNGKDVENPRDLALKVASIDPGKKVELTVIRRGEEQLIEVKLGTLPGDEQLAAKSGNKQPLNAGSALGLELGATEDGRGVQVTGVLPDSMAAGKGLRRGDVIMEVGGVEVDDPLAVTEALKQLREDGASNVLMLVRSGDRQRFVALRMKAS